MYKAASLADGVVKDVSHLVKYKVMQLVKKIIMKYTIISALYHYDTPSNFFLDFGKFFKIFVAFVPSASNAYFG